MSGQHTQRAAGRGGAQGGPNRGDSPRRYNQHSSELYQKPDSQTPGDDIKTLITHRHVQHAADRISGRNQTPRLLDAREGQGQQDTSRPRTGSPAPHAATTGLDDRSQTPRSGAESSARATTTGLLGRSKPQRSGAEPSARAANTGLLGRSKPQRSGAEPSARAATTGLLGRSKPQRSGAELSPRAATTGLLGRSKSPRSGAESQASHPQTAGTGRASSAFPPSFGNADPYGNLADGSSSGFGDNK